MKKILIIGAAVVLVVAAGFGVYSLVSKEDADQHDHTSESSDHSHDTSSETESSTPADTGSEEASSEATVITYTNSGFSPKVITVTSGTTVTIKNESSRNMQFDSDPHPAHTTNEELNVEDVAPGQSQTFVVKRTGTFGYHNHLNASQTGTIIVK